MPSLRAQSLKDIFTFTRSTTATYWNSSGVLTTAAVDEPRIDYDPATLAVRGLLIEEERTNLILNSTTFATQNVTVTNVAHTLSFYGTGTITLSGTSTAGPLVGTGANTRVSLVFTPTAGTLTLTLSGSATMAQLEVGAHATSWIQTASETVTRAADVCYTNTLTPWFNETEGTIYTEFSIPSAFSASGADRYIAQFDDGTYDNRHALLLNDSGSPLGSVSGFTAAGGVTQAYLGTKTPSAGVAYKIAYGWEADNVTVVASGSAAVTDTSATMPSGLSTMRIGNLLSSYAMNGHIRKVKFYPRRLSNTELAALVA